MLILGLDVNDYNTSCALIRNGRVLAAAQEERFCREKLTRRFPGRSLAYCLENQGIELVDLEAVAVSVNPAIYLEALNPAHSERARYRGELLYGPVNYLLGLQPGLDSRSASLRVQFHNHPDLAVHYVTHHDAHAAVGYLPSPFEEAAVFSADGFGEKETTASFHARGSAITRLDSIHFPHSLGLFYAVLTEYLGFQPFRDEWKVMGAAAHGNRRAFQAEFRQLLRYTGEGRFEMNLPYFNHYIQHRSGGYSRKLEELLGPARRPDQEPDTRFFDIAAAAQQRLEAVVFQMLRHLHARTGSRNLCLTGGVAMNCLLNGGITRNTPFEQLFVPPMPDDSGSSIGAALWTSCRLRRTNRRHPMVHNYFGPAFSDAQVRKELERCKIPYREVPDPPQACADMLVSGQIVGWFQGGMEFGDRALGNRSILADPRDPGMKARINEAVKFREPFRPFAPSVLADRAGEFFLDAGPVPFMEQALRVRPGKRSRIPAVVHADGTARVQTVTLEQNPGFHRLIEQFEKLTGIPLVLNTSLNIQGEPIACSPGDAIRTFYSSGLDALFLGSCLVTKTEGAGAGG